MNIQNKDNECVRWCHVRYLNAQKKAPGRVKEVDKLLAQKLNYGGVRFPVGDKDYSRIEKQNDIRVNVFGYENKKAFPIYISSEKYKGELNLLLIEGGGIKHYVLNKDFNRFMFGETKHEGRKFFCMYCLQHMHLKNETLEKHKEDCMVVNRTQAVRMPNEKGK